MLNIERTLLENREAFGYVPKEKPSTQVSIPDEQWECLRNNIFNVYQADKVIQNIEQGNIPEDITQEQLGKIQFDFRYRRGVELRSFYRAIAELNLDNYIMLNQERVLIGRSEYSIQKSVILPSEDTAQPIHVFHMTENSPEATRINQRLGTSPTVLYDPSKGIC